MSAKYQVLATGYYDGPTEGFLVDPGSEKAQFFKVIAWDADQEERLFVVVEVDRAQLARLEALIDRAGEKPRKLIWAPPWRFRDDNDLGEARQIIAQCEEQLKSACELSIGIELSTSSRRIHVKENLRNELANAIDRDEPEDIGAWRAKLRA
ncbi:MAG TPA: hypothetical protein VLB07_06680 [Woeseiaceae bacterium]|nr:hypothetical protein [Woeseiaceae bacterium]